MSPEQITGQPLDGRDRHLPMGIVFWELLTRHRLFFRPRRARRHPPGATASSRRRGNITPRSPKRSSASSSRCSCQTAPSATSPPARLPATLTAVAQYQYEAQALGEFMSSLFSGKRRARDQSAVDASGAGQRPFGQPGRKSGGSSPTQAMRGGARRPDPATLPPASMLPNRPSRQLLPVPPAPPQQQVPCGTGRRARTSLAPAPVLASWRHPGTRTATRANASTDRTAACATRGPPPAPLCRHPRRRSELPAPPRRCGRQCRKFDARPTSVGEISLRT